GVTIDAVPPSGSVFAIGTTTVNVTATDAAGNMTTCSFTVTVQGVEQERVYVADTLNDRVQVFEPIGGSGRFLPNLVGPWHLVPGTTGTAGSGNGQFRRPEAVTANADGSRIYVADTGNNRIQYTTDSGGTWQNFATLGSGLNQVRAPQGLTLDRDGNLYVSDTGNGRVLRFNGGNPGTGVVLASNGTASGQVGRPMGLAIDNLFRLFIPDDLNSRIVRILNANTVTLRDTGSVFVQTGTALNKVRNPQGVAFEADGDMYIADTGNSRVLRFANGNVNSATSIALTGSLLGQVNFAEGVTVTLFTAGPFAGQPMVIIGDTNNNRVIGRFAAGSQWFLVGNPNNLGTGIGQFRSPSKIR
ncbi:MAG TPA: SMP-30/gluconolactonase/LRE family protein, partial [Acidobacteriota bacterium]|nr:SMP-30/gluconolactonase/LRE family protein [Acidobacteriota bacterium]